MDPTLRHHFLNTSLSAAASSVGENGNADELNEDEVLWTTDFTEQSLVVNSATKNNQNNSRTSFQKHSGILTALPESNHRSILYRKSSIPSSSKAMPSIPRPPQSEREYASQSQSEPARKLNQSAPMNVPVLSIAMAKQRNSKFREEDSDDDGEDEEMLPPHEIVARGSRKSPKTTFSVLEGIGRTLKGRDLRQVRNAVFRQTGFLD